MAVHGPCSRKSKSRAGHGPALNADVRPHFFDGERMTHLSIKELDVAKAFGLFVLGAAAGGFVAGAVAGMVWGFVIASTTGDLGDVRRGASVLGGVAGFIVSYFVFRAVTFKFLAPRLAKTMNITPSSSVV